MTLETKRVLITVKAPPNPSKKYQETNCCAGIDLETKQWIRLYPIPFRLLEDDKQFPKYCIISVKCYRPVRDKRVESFKIDQDSIKIEEFIDTKNQWQRRKEIILPTVSSSFCDILQNIKVKKSLGMFKPANVKFEYKKQSAKIMDSAYSQLNLFGKNLKPLESIPYAFYFKFTCAENADCPGHSLKIHDWEITEAYRKWSKNYKDQETLLAKIRDKWLDMCNKKKDTYFYVGNMHRLPLQFMILGVFYPPKPSPTFF